MTGTDTEKIVEQLLNASAVLGGNLICTVPRPGTVIAPGDEGLHGLIGTGTWSGQTLAAAGIDVKATEAAAAAVLADPRNPAWAGIWEVENGLLYIPDRDDVPWDWPGPPLEP